MQGGNDNSIWVEVFRQMSHPSACGVLGCVGEQGAHPDHVVRGRKFNLGEIRAGINRVSAKCFRTVIYTVKI